MANNAAILRTNYDPFDNGRDETDVRVQVNHDRGYGHLRGKIAEGGRAVWRVIAVLRNNGCVGRLCFSTEVIGGPSAARFATAVRTPGRVTHFNSETGPGFIARDRRELADAHAWRHEHRQRDQES